MINYRIAVVKDDRDKWLVEIYVNSDILCCYGQIDTEDDAFLVGEAFIDGIKHVRGES